MAEPFINVYPANQNKPDHDDEKEYCRKKEDVNGLFLGGEMHKKGGDQRSFEDGNHESDADGQSDTGIQLSRSHRNGGQEKESQSYPYIFF